MGITPWNAIGGGKFQSKKQLEERQKSGEGLRSFRGSEQTESERKASEALEKVAGELGTESVTAGTFSFSSRHRLIADSLRDSRACVRDEQGPVLLPHRRRPQD